MICFLSIMMNKFYWINDDQRKRIQKKIVGHLKKKDEIIFAYLHGSFLKNNFRDVDVSVYLDGEISKKKVLDYEMGLESELDKILSYPFDVRVLNHAPLSFRFRVIKDGFLLFSRDEDKRTDFECLTMVEYHDFGIFRKMYLREGVGIEI